MKTRTTILFFAVVVMRAPCLSQELNIGKPGIYKMELFASRDSAVNCTIEVIAYTTTMAHSRCWGSDWENPRSIIAKINLRSGGTEIAVPLSCYADLANPNRARLMNTSGGFCLIMEGGDAATSYRVKVDFCGKRVCRRSVRSMEFPDEAWEMTIYSMEDAPQN